MEFTGCMMKDRFVRINTAPVSEYLDRRARLIEYMDENHLDAIINVNPGRFASGLWLTGEYLSTAFVVERNGAVTVEFANAEDVDGHIVFPDGKILEKSPYPDLKQVTRIDYGEACRGMKKIGTVFAGKPGVFQEVSVSLRKRLGAIEAEICDISNDFNTIKSVHSDLEVEMIMDTGEMFKKILLAFRSIYRRGRLYRDINADVMRLTAELGCPGEFIIILMAIYDRDGNDISVPAGKLPGARAKEGDIVTLLVETNGPSNANAAGSRTFSLGEPSEEFKRAYRVAAQATAFGGSLIYPGNSPKNITQTVKDRTNTTTEQMPDYKFVHSLGYSEAEDPRAEDPRPLIKNTPLICHPEIFRGGRPVYQGEVIRMFNTYVALPGGGKPIFELSDEIVVL